eukprot:CAMPEP_0204520174 /NCGR_PEP_ID=MMETSP0661-20131031/5126_1 /ASSEMBLY_ACC=CAM_ASM_000606 /TAXON_ID=109239 /ORGANISM="Alexandrium margalefi, Strain AMGDE01CS-322" /LENGTH=150 /DNA_ID=CAMNT_0051525719 /DNA_START=77 /DNA_END=526 /DNA_ORIENTATION=+
MAGAEARRAGPLLPALFLGAGVWLLPSLVARPENGSQAFLLSAPPASTRSSRGRTALRGFKEDFESWRSSLTPEEKALVQKQARNEYNKKFRKTDEFKKDLPEEKVKSFAKILGKFFDAEAEDYKKEGAQRTPDYDAFTRQASQRPKEFA